jgi:hypothetical protein
MGVSQRPGAGCGGWKEKEALLHVFFIPIPTPTHSPIHPPTPLHSQPWASRDDACRSRTARALNRALASMHRNLHLSLLRLRVWPEIDHCSRQVSRMMQDREDRAS